MLHDVVQRKKFYTLVLQKCLTRSDDFYKFLFEAEDSIFQLKRSNQSLQKRVNYLTERLDTLENEKDSSILNKLKRGF